MLKAIISCIVALARTGEAIAGFALSAFGGVLELTGFADIPTWAWLSGAVVLLFAMAVRLQMQLDDQEGQLIRRLKKKRYVTFGEIAKAISTGNIAYTEAEVLDCLLSAALAGEFKEWTGHSRLRMTGFDGNYAPTNTYPIFSYEDLADYTNDRMNPNKKPTAGVIAYERSLFRMSLQQEPPPQSGANIWMALEHGDFCRWYRRFRNGKYER